MGTPLFRVDKVLLWAFKSDESIRAAKLAATLFPQASFYLIMVVPSARARFFLTTLYREVLEVIASEVFESIERELSSLGARIASRKRVFGRAPSAVESYAREIGANLVATSISMELGVEDVENSPVAKLVEISSIPTLIHTPLSKSVETVARVAIAFGAYSEPKHAIEFVRDAMRVRSALLLGVEEGANVGRARELAKKLGIEVEATCLGEVSSRVVGELERVTEGADLLLIDRRSLVPREAIRVGRRRLTTAEKVLLSVSRAPTIFIP